MLLRQNKATQSSKIFTYDSIFALTRLMPVGLAILVELSSSIGFASLSPNQRCEKVFLSTVNTGFANEVKKRDENEVNGPKSAVEANLVGIDRKYSEEIKKMISIKSHQRAIILQVDELFKKSDQIDEFSEEHTKIYSRISRLQKKISDLQSQFDQIGINALQLLEQTLIEKDFKVRIIYPGAKEIEFLHDIMSYFSFKNSLLSKYSLLKSLKAINAPDVVLNEEIRFINKAKRQMDAIEKKYKTSQKFQDTVKQLTSLFLDSKPAVALKSEIFKNFKKPYLLLEALPETKLVESFAKNYNTSIISSPFIQVRDNAAAGIYFNALVEAFCVIHISGEVLLNFENHVESPEILHEIRHTHFAKNRKKGTLNPFNIVLEIADETLMLLPQMSKLSYAKMFSFEEIATNLHTYRLQKDKFENADLVSAFLYESHVAVLAALRNLKQINSLEYKIFEDRFIVKIPIEYNGNKRIIWVTLLSNPGGDLEGQKKAIENYLKYVAKELVGLRVVLTAYALKYPTPLN